MAVNKWTGGTNDANTAGNWSDGLPTTDDDLMFLSEYASATALSVNPAAHTAVDVNSIYVGPGYTLGIAGTGAHFDIGADKVHYQGSTGKLWLKTVDAGGGPTDRIVVDSTDANPLAHDCISLNGAAGTFTRLTVLRGWANIESGATVTNIIVGSRNPGVTESKLVINSGAASSTTAQIWSGIVTANANPTTLIMFGGTWTQDITVITSIIMYGGRLNLDFGGTYASVQHYGGIIDCTRRGGQKIFTQYERSPGAILLGEGNVAAVSLPAASAPPDLVYIV